MFARRFRSPTASCAGFTLVELSLSVLIIGILLAMILKGSALLDSARTKAVFALAKDIKQASHAFKERYYYLPGDLPDAISKLPAVATDCSYAGGLAGNGMIDDAKEKSCVVDHLFIAGLLKADADSANVGRYLPLQTPYGSAWLSSAATSGVAGLPNSVQNVIVFSNLPCATAVQVDHAFDDGNLGTGRVRGSVASCASGGLNDLVPLLAVPL